MSMCFFEVSRLMTEDGRGAVCLGLVLKVCEESLVTHPKDV